MADQTIFDEAYHYFERGLNVVPLGWRSKTPEKGFDLRARFQTRTTLDEIRLWFGKAEPRNIGLIMGQISGVVAIDADTVESAKELYKKLPQTAMMTKTANGGHFLFRIRDRQVVTPRVKAKVKGVVVDIRGEGSYVVAAPSIHPSGKRYELLGRWELVDVPYFDLAWLDAPIKQESRAPISNVSKYLSKIDAVSGQGGHNQTYRAVCKLRDAGLTPEQALVELIEWNNAGHAKPAWSTRELLHKIESVYRKGGKC